VNVTSQGNISLELDLLVNATMNGTLLVSQFSQNIENDTVSGRNALALFYDFTLDSVSLGNFTNATVRMCYDDLLITSSLNENSLQLYTFNSTTSQWEELSSQSLDTAGNCVTGVTTHLSSFGLFGTAPIVTPVSSDSSLGGPAGLGEGRGSPAAPAPAPVAPAPLAAAPVVAAAVAASPAAAIGPSVPAVAPVTLKSISVTMSATGVSIGLDSYGTVGVSTVTKGGVSAPQMDVDLTS